MERLFLNATYQNINRQKFTLLELKVITNSSRGLMNFANSNNKLYIENKKQRLHRVPQSFSQGYLEIRVYVNKVDVKNMIVQDKID